MNFPKISQTRKLYLAVSFEELTELAKIDKTKISMSRIKSFLKDIIKTAHTASEVGDEETAFVNYTIFLNYLQILESSTKFHSQHDAVLLMLGGIKGLDKLLSVLQELELNLRERYKKRNVTEKIERGITSGIFVDPFNVQNIEKPKRKSMSDTNIDCWDLHAKIKNNYSNFILLDCRSKIDFETSRILHDSVLNVPIEMLNDPLHEKNIIQKFNQEKLWESMLHKEVILLMDYESTFLVKGTPVWLVQNILEQMNFTSNISILLVTGGYRYFQLLYPNECSIDKNIQPLEFSEENNNKCKRKELERKDARAKRTKLQDRKEILNKLAMLETKSEEITLDYNLLHKKQIEFITQAKEVTSMMRDHLKKRDF